MWFMDMIQEAMKEILIDWTLHNFIVFTVITSSSVLSVVGALRHIYVFAQKIQAKKPKLVKKAVVQKSKRETSFTEELNGDKLLSSHFINNQQGKNALVKDSILYQKVLQKVKENIECLQCLQCDCVGPVRRCVHNLCRKCCERSGWCRRKTRGHQSTASTFAKSNSHKPKKQFVSMSYRSLHEVPHRLGFRYMTATAVDLSHNFLSQLPEHIALIRQLQKINLSHNFLAGIPTFFSSFHRLTTIDFRYNSLSTFPDVLIELKSLQNLYLDHNNFCQVPADIYRLQNLIHLGLGHNSISKIAPSLFKICGLRILRLCGNPKLTHLPASVGWCIGLEVLDVSGCHLEFIPASLGRCSMLRHLILHNNRLSYIPCEISHCSRLITLNVSNNPLTCLPGTLHYHSSRLSLNASCSSFSTHLKHRGWQLQDEIPSLSQVKGGASLFHLARVCVRKHDIDISCLPFLLKGELLSYSSCFYCGYKTTPHCLRVIKCSTFGSLEGPKYPFTYTFCVKHFHLGKNLEIEPEERVLAQFDHLCHS